MAKKTMTLEEGEGLRGERKWRVVQLTDSIEYKITEYLEKEVVESLCLDPAWKITIKPVK